MEISFKNYNSADYLPKFQEGGEMAPPAEAPVQEAPAAPAEGGEDPTAQILQAAAQALQSQDCNLAMQVLQALLEMAGAGAQQAPAAPEGQEPVYRKGGRLSRWVKK